MVGKNTCLVVTVIRHAETDQNAAVPRILQGQSESAINALGMKQAAALAWRLKKERFDHIYTSDLVRAKQTAYEIAKHHSNTPLSKDTRLREQDLGDLTGLAWPQAKQILKTEDRSFDEHIAEKGESNRLFKERVVDFYSNVVECHLVDPHDQLLRASSTDSLADNLNDEQAGYTPDSDRSVSSLHQSVSHASLRTPRAPRMRQINILIVTHGGWIQRLMEHILEDLGFSADCDILHGFPKNSAAYRFSISKIFDREGVDYEWEGRINLMNCVAHLAAMNRRPDPVTGIVTPAAQQLKKNGQSPAGSPAALRKSRLAGMGSNASGLSFTKKSLAQSFAQPKMAPHIGNVPTARVKSLGW
ncbi:hypothetical protein HKX48_007620 [Thoreauomyces humboldtii]|nr:hypothetical protein HKX48_007620 [Thoreauomyces humboldtii]